MLENVCVLAFRITREITKFVSFDLVKLTNFETAVTAFVFFPGFHIQIRLVHQAVSLSNRDPLVTSGDPPPFLSCHN
jgi:hypothetical protein